MERKTIPLHFCKSKVPIMTFRLADDKERYAIVDTGSDITMLSVDMKDILETRETDQKTRLVSMNKKGKYEALMEAFTQATVKTDKDEDVKIVIGGILYDMRVVSSHFQKKGEEQMEITVIIGGDFLKYYNAKIDYEKHTLTIDG